MAMQRTDLAAEAHALRGGALDGVRQEEESLCGFPVTRVTVETPAGAAALGKPMGVYLTVELEGYLRRESDSFARAAQALAQLLRPLVPPEGEVLTVGLGNRAITPDLVGPLAVEHTLVTRHLVRAVPDRFGALRPVAALAPGVLAQTGAESGELIQAAAARLRPSCVIAVDALAARSAQRLCRTVQISDTGIVPGSGVGNHRMALNRETLGVPVIAVGVPTVVEASTLVMDLLGREDIAGLPGAGLFVTPRDIDRKAADLARVIGYGISLALAPSLTVEELELLLR